MTNSGPVYMPAITIISIMCLDVYTSIHDSWPYQDLRLLTKFVVNLRRNVLNSSYWGSHEN